MDAPCIGVPRRGPLGHSLKLDPADRGLHLEHSPVGSEALVQPAESRRVLTLVHRVPALAVVLVRPDRFPQIFVVDRDHSAFAAGGHDLVLAEGPRADVADRADAAAFVAGAVGLGAVLDHLDAARPRELHDRIHVDGITAEVHDDDRARALGQHRPDRFGRDIAAVAVDVGEHRRSRRRSRRTRRTR